MPADSLHLTPIVKGGPKSPLIEIHGAGFQNKGAQLMLSAVIGELRQRLPQFRAAIDPTYGPYHSRCQLSLYQILPPRSHVGTPGFSKRFHRQKIFSSMGGARLLKMLGIAPNIYGGVRISEITAFIDIAGFAYTDEWGARPTQDLALLTGYYKTRGKPIIFLPQAFGPFRQHKTRSAFKKVLENATLIFARDQQSYEYILELSPKRDNCLKAPDITLFYPPLSPSIIRPQPEIRYACVVPNIRILDRGIRTWGEKYYSYLLQVIQVLLRHDLNVRVVVHDSTGEDLKLAEHLCEEASSASVSLVQEEDPIALKKLIAGSLMVVGSRYHSLVAAMSQCVPSVAIGWSHKYDMLFREFGFDTFVFSSPDTSIDMVLERVAELADYDKNTSHRQLIHRHLQDMHVTNQRMWSLVTDVLLGHAF